MSRAAGIANIQYTLGTSREIAEDIIADHGDAFNVEPEDVVAGKDAVAGEGSQDQPGATD